MTAEYAYRGDRSMMNLLLKCEGYTRRLEKVARSWEKISLNALKYIESRGPSREMNEICRSLECLVKALQIIPPYKSLDYIPSGRWLSLLHSLEKRGYSKSKLESDLKSCYLPSILYGIANGYIITVDHGNMRYFARSPLGDLLIDKYRDLGIDQINVTGALLYLFGGLFLPTRTSLIYLTMKSLSLDDTEKISKALKANVFSGGLKGYERLAVSLIYEFEETLYLWKYQTEDSEKYKYITPAHAAYVLAKVANKLINFEDYKRILYYVSEGEGLFSVDGFKGLFRGALVSRDKVKELIMKDPIISSIGVLFDELRKHYKELNREISRLTSL